MAPRSYVLIESRYFLHGCPRTCYGIALIEEGDSVETVLQTVCDVSPDRQLVFELVELCNRTLPAKRDLVELLEEFLG